MKEKHHILLLFTFILLSRLLFLSSDLGIDPDSYRFGLNAEKILTEHRYYLSRSPGNPLYEILNAPLLVYGGGWLTNLGTILASLAGLLAFYLILKQYGFKRRLLMVALLAFTPVAWINSLVTMDYWWSLALILWAFYAALIRRYTLAAILAGLSFGFRVPAGFIILPILLVVWIQEKRWARVLEVLAVFAITALVSFSPVLLTYGFSQWNYVPYEHPKVIGLYRAVRHILGVPGAVIVGLAVVITGIQRLKRGSGTDREKLIQAAPWLLWLVLMAAMFWQNPSGPAYLLPAIPFALLLLDAYLKPGWWVPIAAFVILNNFVSFVVVDTEAYKRDSRLAIRPASQGVFLKYLDEVAQSQQELRDLQALKLHPSDDGTQPLILVSSFFPELRYHLRREVADRRDLGVSPYRTEIIKVSGCWYGRELSRDDLQKLMAEKFQVYYTQDADFATRSIFRYKLADVGALALAEIK